MTRWSKALGDAARRSDAAGVDVAKIEAGWERVRARRARPRALRRAAVVAPMFVLAALLVVVARFGFGSAEGTATTLAPSVPVPLTAPESVAPLAVPAPPGSVAPLALASGTPLPPEWTAPVQLAIALDDGSHLELAPTTHLTTHRGAPERVELALDRGRTTFDVKPGGPRAWIIDAGSVRVEVLGTRFTVSRHGAHVEVSVERGKVKVTDRKGAAFSPADSRSRRTERERRPRSRRLRLRAPRSGSRRRRPSSPPPLRRSPIPWQRPTRSGEPGDRPRPSSC